MDLGRLAMSARRCCTAVCFVALCCADVAGATLDAHRLREIPARMEEFVRRGTIAGSVTLLAIHGKVVSLEAVGYQDLERKRPMQTGTIFQVMSVTKPVTAVAIMMLAEQGSLAINDPVERFLPEFHTAGARFRAITIADLLTHTSGLSGEDPQAIRDPAVKQSCTLAEVAKLVSQMPVEFEPGTRYRYSGPGFAVLGRIVEVVSGKPYEDFLQQRIFKPLGMKQSFFFPPRRKHDRIAEVYEMENGTLRPAGVDLYRAGAKYANPAGGLFSTAGDMARFCQMMLNGGTYGRVRLLSRASVAEMTRIQLPEVAARDAAGTGYGLGWSVVGVPSPSLPLLFRSAFGHSGAFGTYAWVDPSKDLVAVFLTQETGDSSSQERNDFLALVASSLNQ